MSDLIERLKAKQVEDITRLDHYQSELAFWAGAILRERIKERAEVLKALEAGAAMHFAESCNADEGYSCGSPCKCNACESSIAWDAAIGGGE